MDVCDISECGLNLPNIVELDPHLCRRNYPKFSFRFFFPVGKQFRLIL